MTRACLAFLIPLFAAEQLCAQQPLTYEETNAAAEVSGMLTDGIIRCKPWITLIDHETLAVGWLSATQALGYVEWKQEGMTWQRADMIEDGLKGSLSTMHGVRLKPCDLSRPLTFRVVTQVITRFQPYKVTFGEPHRSTDYVIPPVCTNGSTSFMVFNDIHNRTQFYPLLYRALIEPKPVQFVVLNGDVLQDPQTEGDIEKNLLAPMAWLTAQGIPAYFLRGNHETRGAAARQLKAYLQRPENCFYGALNCGPAAILFLDSGEDKPDDSAEYSGLVDFDAYMKAQRTWCERTLSSPSFTQSRWRIVIMHIPPDWTRKGDDLRWGMKRLCNDFIPLFTRYRVTAVISGHMHTPQVIDPTAQSEDTITWPIIIGGAHPLPRATGIRVEANQQHLRITLHASNGSTICERIFH